MRAYMIPDLLKAVFGLWLFWQFEAIAHASPEHQRGAFSHDVSWRDLVTPEHAKVMEDTFDGLETITWSLYVPPDYDPDKPPGIFVFISPIKDGTIRPRWRRVFDQHNMIYISASGAGNYVPSKRRFYHSALAVKTVQSLYKTDERVRIISGFSGGGRMSSRILELLPGVFTGGLMIGGAFDWAGSDEDLKTALGEGAFVFLTGTRDQAEWETRRAYLQYRDAGIADVKYISVRGMTHRFPDAKEMDQALSFLNQHLRD